MKAAEPTTDGREETRQVRQQSWMALNTDDTHEHELLPSKLVGFHSNHGISPGQLLNSYHVKTNQDRCAL